MWLWTQPRCAKCGSRHHVATEFYDHPVKCRCGHDKHVSPCRFGGAAGGYLDTVRRKDGEKVTIWRPPCNCLTTQKRLCRKCACKKCNPVADVSAEDTVLLRTPSPDYRT